MSEPLPMALRARITALIWVRGRLRLCKSRRRSTRISQPRSRRRLLSCRPFGWPPSLPPVPPPPPPPLVGDFAQLPGSGYLMAGGNFLGRVISYVVNELVVEGLANNRAFQRFAVRTSKAIEDVSTKASQARERLVAQLKDATKDDDSFRRP
ncbi:unnamed protein product [Musa hybrid cultivar]